MANLIEVTPVRLSATLNEYKALIPHLAESLHKTAALLHNLPVIHINATPNGGGVSELLHAQVPLEQTLGLKSRWFTIHAPKKFFIVTKTIHNLLQGKQGKLTDKDFNLYLRINQKLSHDLQSILKKHSSGIVVIHDPQPLPLVTVIPKPFRTILRIHIDLSSPEPITLERLRPFIVQADRVIVSHSQYRNTLTWLPVRKVRIIAPAIDPFSEKNRPLSPETAAVILERFGINPTHPIVTQVSRFDPWKDPVGVIRAYYLAKNKIPDLQLVLAGFQSAQDDPEASSVFETVKKYAKGDPSIHLFSDPKILKDITEATFVNALYTGSTVMIQKSLREGFGLVVTEAMHKGKAIIAGMTTGTMLQIKNRKSGLLVASPEETAQAVVKLIKNKKLRDRLGGGAKQRVQRFLMPHYIYENLKAYAQLIKH